jgi:hypothetical protein
MIRLSVLEVDGAVELVVRMEILLNPEPRPSRRSHPSELYTSEEASPGSGGPREHEIDPDVP